MATTIQLIKNNEFSKDDLLKVISQLVHEGYYNNNDIIEIVKYLVDDILQAKTRVKYSKEINPRTGRKRSYNSHEFAKGERFLLSNIEFICDNR